MEKSGSLHASPSPPSRLYLPRHFSCSACLYGRLAEPSCQGGCGVEAAEPVAMPDAQTTGPTDADPVSPPPLSPDGASSPSPPSPRSPSPPPPPPSPSSRGREPTVPPSPALRRRAKSLPTPGDRGGGGGLRPALQHQSPSRRKTVRFADALGLELTVVRHFCQADVPRVAARGGVGSGSGSDLLKTRRPPALGDLGPVLFGPPAPALEPLFPPRPGAVAGFGERVRRHKVRLEWARPEAGGLRGAVRVLNVAYEKRVSVRYTLNRWASCNEVPAAYQPPPGAGAVQPPELNLTDRFAFHLPVDGGTTLLEFALRYRVAGAEYWDNNDGHNYKLRARPRAPNGPADDEGDGGGAWIHFI